MTDDHNVYNELIKRKKLTREQVAQLAPKNAITRAVGVYESCEPDALVLDVLAGDRFLLCSDGLSGVVSRSTIHKTMQDVEDPGDCADALVALVVREQAV